MNGRRASGREVEEGQIFWFDIEAMRYVMISDDVGSSVGEGQLVERGPVSTYHL